MPLPIFLGFYGVTTSRINIHLRFGYAADFFGLL
jgi:hypothetical protein